MKTKKNEKGFNWPMQTKLFIGIIMLLNISTLLSQKSEKLPFYIGAGVGTHVSGNAHGVFYDVYGSLYNGKSLVSLGACIQKRSNSICGTRLSYSYIVYGGDNFLDKRYKFSNDEKLQLYFFGYLQYLNNTPLSFGSIKREELLSQGSEHNNVDFNKLKLSTVEAGLGFGLNKKLNQQFVLGSYLGLSTYYHSNYVNGMYGDKIAPVLILGTTLGFNFFKGN